MDGRLDTILRFLSKIIGKRGAKTIVCLVLMSAGLSQTEIKDKTGMSWDALRKYRKALDEKEIDALFELKADRMKSDLLEYEELIVENFDKAPPKTLAEAKKRIKELTGIDRSINRIRVFLKKRGLKAGLAVSTQPKQM